jgi:type I restriction enzyme, S subunit
MSELHSVKNLVTSTLKGITPKYVERSNVIVLNQKCIRDNKIDYSFAQYHDSTKRFSPSKALKVGDILINSTGQGTAGRCAFVNLLPSDCTVITDSHILIVRVDDFHTAGCLEYSLFGIESLLQTYVDGSTGQGEFDKERLFNIVTGLPSAKKRKPTYELLNNIALKIDYNNRINAELEAMAKTLYDYWFVQFDFPDTNGKPYKSSGGKMVHNTKLKQRIPLGWDDGVASDLIDFNPSISLRKNAEASYIDMAALPVTGFMTDAPVSKPFAGGMKFQNGDVVVARITPCLENGKTALISLLKDGEVGFGSTEFIVLRGKGHALSAFAAELSRSASFRQFAISNMTGTSGRKRIDATTLESFSMPVPPEDLLLKYENLVSPCFKWMTKNTKENQQLAQLRDWLLPLLMNGQVTVS